MSDSNKLTPIEIQLAKQKTISQPGDHMNPAFYNRFHFFLEGETARIVLGRNFNALQPIDYVESIILPLSTFRELISMSQKALQELDLALAKVQNEKLS